MPITIIDYGIGNLRSIEMAFERLGASVVRMDDHRAIEAAHHLVLPGVGAFGACIREVRSRSLVAPIHGAVARGVPFLGVCVGMQMLFDESHEGGVHAGLGLIPGRVSRFDLSAHAELKVPHIGWNQVLPRRPVPLLDGTGPAPWCYFANSYYANCAAQSDVIAQTVHGISFPSIVGRDNLYGVQFHPEKSHQSGLRILQNFAALR